MEDYRILINLADSYRGSGIIVKVMKKVSLPGRPIRYESLFDNFITPFLIGDNPLTQEGTSINISEIVNKIKLNKYEFDNPPDGNRQALLSDKSKAKSTEKTETTVSRGYCLEIPDIGSILITHNGDLALNIYDKNTDKEETKSLHIETPNQIILNTTDARHLDLDIIASNVVLTGECKALLHSLKFHKADPTDDLLQGLFIDEKSLLGCTNLLIEDSLMLLLGSLTIYGDLTVNGGLIFNMGEFRYGKTTEIINNSYFFNGTRGSIFCHNSFYVDSIAISNLGKIDIEKGTIKTEKIFDNQGIINISDELEITGGGDFVNVNTIESLIGKIRISSKSFAHKRGIINMKEVEVLSLSTLIESKMNGTKASFRNNTLNNNELKFQDISISGTFLNRGKISIQNSFILDDEKAQIVNTASIETGDVVSCSLNGIIEGGKCNAKSFKVSGNLLVNASFPSLDYVQVEESGTLVLPIENKNPVLKRITNNGKARILSKCPKLETIENGINAVFQLETDIFLSNVKSFSKISGKSDIKAKFQNLTILNLPKNATMNLMEGTKLSNVKSLIIGKDSILNIENGVLSSFNVETIYNFGKFYCHNPLTSLLSIYNGPEAELCLLEEIKVKGRQLNNDDTQTFKTIDYIELVSKGMKKLNKPQSEKSKEEEMIGVYNEGKILVRASMSSKSTNESSIKPLNPIGNYGKSMLQFVPSNLDSKKMDNKNLKGLKIGQKYVASKDAILVLENSAIISASDFINYGTIYSSEKMKIDQLTEISRLGVVTSKKGTDYNAIQTPILFDGTFCAFVLEDPKILNIESNTGIFVTNENNMNINMRIIAPTFKCQGNLKLKSLFIETIEFFIDQANKKGSKTDIEKYSIETTDNFEIHSRLFLNDGGKLLSQGKLHSKIIVEKLFQNTGGGEFSSDHQTITWYTIDNNCRIQTNQTELNTRTYKPHFEKAGLIASGGSLDIFVGDFNNCFGHINSAVSLNIESSFDLNNECGMIYCGGKTTFKGDSFDNGYKKGNQIFVGIDPNKPIKEIRTVSENYERVIPTHSTFFGLLHLHVTAYINRPVVVGYEQSIQYNKLSKYPGYIFSVGDLDIDTEKPCYIGTIVSQGSIRIKGQIQQTCNNSDFGKIIATKDIKAEFDKIQLEQLMIEAQNAYFKLIEDLVIKGVIKNVQLQDGRMTHIIDISKFSGYFGFTIPQNTFRLQGDKRVGPGNLISLNPNVPIEEDVLILPTEETGFFNKVESEVFVSSIQNSVLNQIVRLILTPLQGRDVLLHIDLIDELRKKGAALTSSFKNSQEIVLKDGDPALIFQKLENEEVELEVDGEKVQVPLCNPYLIVNSVSKLMASIRVDEKLSFDTIGNIKYEPGKVDIETEDLTLHARNQVEIASEFVYTGIHRTGINQTSIHVPGTLKISGDQGVTMKGVDFLANKIKIKSSNGSVYDFEMPLDMKMNYDIPYNNWYTITGHQYTHTSALRGNFVELVAPKGTIDQHGTTTFVGEGGIKIEGNYRYTPAYESSYYFERRHKRMAESRTTYPKQGGIMSAGNVLFMTKDATLIGATIIAPKIINPLDGNIRFLPAFIDQHNWSYEEKSNMFGSSSVEITQDRHIPVGCRILAEEFYILGSGTLEMEGITAKIVNATITKNIEERAAYETSHTVITQKASGFCPPKINGDAFVDSFKNITNSFTCFEDSVAGVLNLGATFFSHMEHLDTLLNLGNIQNPIASIAKILLSRFVTSFSYSNVKSTTTIDIKEPVQSQFEIEVLQVSNDRTHLEGVYNIKNKATIETNYFETKAPERTMHSHTETSGYSISLNPVSLACACIEPTVLTVGASLPNVSVFHIDQDVRKKENAAQVLSADDLFIRCNDAVFSGSKIQARLVEAIVSGDLTLEDLTNEFISVSHSSTFSINLGGIFSLIHSISAGNENSPQQEVQKAFEKTFAGELKNSIVGETFLNPAWGAIPHIRIADEKTITREVQNLSAFVGREKFYLHVAGCLHKKSALLGLVQPDGVVVHNENEKIEAGRILDEKIAETHHHEKHVFNPCVAEFVGMMSSFASMQRNDILIEAQKKDIERREKNKALNEGYSDQVADKKSKEKGKEFDKDMKEFREKYKKVKELCEQIKKEEQEAQNNKEQKSSPKTNAKASATSKLGISQATKNSGTQKPSPPTSTASSSSKTANQATKNSVTQKTSNSTSTTSKSTSTTSNSTSTTSKSGTSGSKTEPSKTAPQPELSANQVPKSEPKYYCYGTDEYLGETPKQHVEHWEPNGIVEKAAKYIIEFYYKAVELAEKYPTATAIFDTALEVLSFYLSATSGPLKNEIGNIMDKGIDGLILLISHIVAPDEIIEDELSKALMACKSKLMMLFSVGKYAKGAIKAKSLTKGTMFDKELNDLNKLFPSPSAKKTSKYNYGSDKPKASFQQNSYAQEAKVNVKVDFGMNSTPKAKAANTKNPSNVEAHFNDNAFAQEPSVNMNVVFGIDQNATATTTATNAPGADQQVNGATDAYRPPKETYYYSKL